MAPVSVSQREHAPPSTVAVPSSPRPAEPPAYRRVSRWLWGLIAVGAYAVGLGAAAAGLPSPWLLGALLVGAVLALSGRVQERVPSGANRASQALVGALMGSYLTLSALVKAAPTALPLTFVTAATIALSVAVAWFLARDGALSRPTAVLGMVPGGSAAIVTSAEELEADVRLVAFTQYLRVGLVAMTAPLVARWMATGTGTPGGAAGLGSEQPGPLHLVDSSHQMIGLLTLLAVSWTGTRLGRRFRMPTPALIGPMLAGLVVTMSGALPGFAPMGLLQNGVFVLVGLDVGVRFTRDAVLRVRRMLPKVFIALTAVCLGCAGLAWILAAATGTRLVDAYLSTTPGGINAVLATAVSTHADLALISTVQSLRLLAVVFATPLIIRMITTARTSADTKA